MHFHFFCVCSCSDSWNTYIWGDVCMDCMWSVVLHGHKVARLCSDWLARKQSCIQFWAEKVGINVTFRPKSNSVCILAACRMIFFQIFSQFKDYVPFLQMCKTHWPKFFFLKESITFFNGFLIGLKMENIFRDRSINSDRDQTAWTANCIFIQLHVVIWHDTTDKVKWDYMLNKS